MGKFTKLAYFAIIKHDLKKLKKIIKKDKHLPNKFYENISLLVHCINNNFFDGLKILLEKGANPNLPDMNLNVPLHYAKNIYAIQILKAYGAKINKENNDGETPIFNFANNLEMVKVLFEGEGKSKIYKILTKKNRFNKNIIEKLIDNYNLNAAMELIIEFEKNLKKEQIVDYLSNIMKKNNKILNEIAISLLFEDIEKAKEISKYINNLAYYEINGKDPRKLIKTINDPIKKEWFELFFNIPPEYKKVKINNNKKPFVENKTKMMKPLQTE